MNLLIITGKSPKGEVSFVRPTTAHPVFSGAAAEGTLVRFPRGEVPDGYSVRKETSNAVWAAASEYHLLAEQAVGLAAGEYLDRLGLCEIGSGNPETGEEWVESVVPAALYISVSADRIETRVMRAEEGMPTHLPAPPYREKKETPRHVRKDFLPLASVGLIAIAVVLVLISVSLESKRSVGVIPLPAAEEVVEGNALALQLMTLFYATMAQSGITNIRDAFIQADRPGEVELRIEFSEDLPAEELESLSNAMAVAMTPHAVVSARVEPSAVVIEAKPR